METDLFKFYRIPVSFDIDQDHLNNKFLEYNKLYLPDFSRFKSKEEHMRQLELSELNIKAFKLLSNDEQRTAYILELYGLLPVQDVLAFIPDHFLDLGAAVESSIRERNADALRILSEDLDRLLAEVKGLLEEVKVEFDRRRGPDAEETLPQIRNLHLQSGFLLSIREMLDSFTA